MVEYPHSAAAACSLSIVNSSIAAIVALSASSDLSTTYQGPLLISTLGHMQDIAKQSADTALQCRALCACETLLQLCTAVNLDIPSEVTVVCI
jgi:hypothetical protein